MLATGVAINHTKPLKAFDQAKSAIELDAAVEALNHAEFARTAAESRAVEVERALSVAQDAHGFLRAELVAANNSAAAAVYSTAAASALSPHPLDVHASFGAEQEQSANNGMHRPLLSAAVRHPSHVHQHATLHPVAQHATEQAANDAVYQTLLTAVPSHLTNSPGFNHTAAGTLIAGTPRTEAVRKHCCCAGVSIC
jgi:hypothetical protein